MSQQSKTAEDIVQFECLSVCLKPLARSDQHRNFIIDLVQGNLGLPKENFEYSRNDLAYLCRQIVPLSKSPGTIEGEVFLSPQLRYFQLFSRLLFSAAAADLNISKC